MLLNKIEIKNIDIVQKDKYANNLNSLIWVGIEEKKDIKITLIIPNIIDIICNANEKDIFNSSLTEFEINEANEYKLFFI